MDPTNDYVEVWHADDGWRWRRRDEANHDIVAESGEAYTAHSSALEAAAALNDGCPIVDTDGDTL